MFKPVLPLMFFSLDLFFFCFIWRSGDFIENLGFFDSGQILEKYVVLLYFPFKNTVVTSFTGVNRKVQSQYPVQLSRARFNQIVWNLA